MQWTAVYIREAHASDIWPLKFTYEQLAPTTLAERCARARALARELALDVAGFELLVDGMDDSLDAALGAWPTNYYVLGRDGSLLFDAVAAADAAGACEGGGEVRRLEAYVRHRLFSALPQAAAERRGRMRRRER